VKWSSALCALGGILCLLIAPLAGRSEAERAARASRPLESLTLGSQAVLVDYYWFDLLQYFGAYRLGEHDLREFAPRYERLVGLDPGFHRATIFASTVRATDLGDAEGAVIWLRRAEALNPDHWIYPYEQGFIHYLWLENYQAAERDFIRAGQKPGAPPAWRHFVARIRELGGNPVVAYEMWREIADSAEHPRVRETALKNLERLERTIAQTRRREPGT